MKKRSYFRKTLLTLGIFVCTFQSAKFLTPQNFYSTITAIFLLTITITDFEQQIIFDKILIPFAIIEILSVLHLNLNLTDHLLAGIFSGGIFLLLAVLSKGGIGGGDIKFISCLGFCFGIEKTFSIVTFGMIFSGIAALIFILFCGAKSKDLFAYAPYFALTALYFLFS